MQITPVKMVESVTHARLLPTNVFVPMVSQEGIANKVNDKMEQERNLARMDYARSIKHILAIAYK